MDRLSRLIGDKSKRKITFVLLLIGCFSLILAFIIGISDNPPGILLCFVGITSLMLMFSHHWREIKKFTILLIFSIAGFPVSVVLHNLLYGLGKMFAENPILSQIFESLHVLFFLIAILICPPGILIGALGSLILHIRGKKSKEISSEV